MAYTPKKLDVDLFVDRTKVVLPDDLILTYPDAIRIQSSYTFKIENYDPRDTYEITFSKGTWFFTNGLIYYTAPSDYFGPLKLTIKQTKASFKGFVLFSDGSIYDEEGTISKAEKTNDGKWIYDYQVSSYEEDLEKYYVEPSPPPIPTTKKHPETISLGDYSPTKFFGELGSYTKIKDVARAKKNGNFMDYYLPSEYNKEPDEEKFFYKTEKGKYVSVPRNSNVTESSGDIFSGYRKPGDVGSSLTVYKGSDQLTRIFEWDFEILLGDLRAILPEMIISICLEVVSFSPILVGLETGHTFYWEQISGDQSTVIWLTPRTQKDVTIELGNIRTDRVFRFWISKGTRYERYYDITVYGTPFDNIKDSIGTAGPFKGICQNHLNTKVHECTPIVLTYENIWNKQLRVNIIRNY